MTIHDIRGKNTRNSYTQIHDEGEREGNTL